MTRVSRRFVLKASAAGAVAGLAPGTASAQPSFAMPEAGVRPSIEWFVPLAPTSDAEIAREVAAMARAGIGSAQLLAWSVPDVDLTTHGWATPAWNDRVRAALSAARRHGITIDLTLGADVLAAVPTITPDDPAASTELVYGVTPVPSTYDGPVPPPKEFDQARVPGTPVLVAVTAARVATGSLTAKPVLLDPASIVDLTSSVRAGRVVWTPPRRGQWLLFGFWRRGTGQVNDGTATPAYAIDYYGPAGARAMLRYWEENLLAPDIRRLLRQAGGSLHEEPMELNFVLPWTTSLLDRFHRSHGYRLVPYLPVLFIEQLHNYGYVGPGVAPTPADAPDFDLVDGTGSRIRDDFYQTLSDLYREHHLDPIGRWARDHGLRHSVKLGPGAFRDRQAAVLSVDEPEFDQVFFFDDETDCYRTLSGAVHMGRKRVYASEVSPVTDVPLADAYGVTWQRMLDIINQNYAAGITQAKLHYFAYADAPGATWPGWAPLAPLGDAPGMAEAWGPRQPTWRHMPDITGYLARQQFVLRTGRPRVDVAIYRHALWEPSAQPNSVWRDRGLRRAGYTYDFIGPALLDLPTARVTGGRLDADGPGYRALILNRQTSLPPRTAERIRDFARSGLPVVHVQSESDAPRALAELGVTPDAAYDEPVDLLTVHRADPDTDYYWYFNTSDRPIEVDVSMRGRGRPYTLDAWTGTITAVDAFTRRASRITVPIRLAPKQTTIIALAAHLPGAQPARTVTQLTPIPLHAWHLRVDDWRPAANVRHDLELPELQPWSHLPQLADSSGIGTYTTTVTLPSLDGAYLDLGAVHGTVRVSVNGRPLPPVDQTRPVADLRGRLIPGANTIQVEVATTLRNRLRLLAPSQAVLPRQDYGLLGPVMLIPYAEASRASKPA